MFTIFVYVSHKDIGHLRFYRIIIAVGRLKFNYNVIQNNGLNCNYISFGQSSVCGMEYIQLSKEYVIEVKS